MCRQKFTGKPGYHYYRQKKIYRKKFTGQNWPTKSAAGLLLRLKKFTEKIYRCGPGLLPAKKNVPKFHFWAWTTTTFGTFSFILTV